MSEISAIFGLGFMAGLAFFVWLGLNPAHRPVPASERFGREVRITVPEVPAPPEQLALNTDLRVNDVAIGLIKTYESLSLEAYLQSGHWRIGYGHIGAAVHEGLVISAAEADALLRQDLAAAEDVVRRAVTVPLNENEFSALALLTYNIGPKAFAGSAALRLLNEGDREGAADALLLWNRLHVDGELIESELLSDRRAAERDLFLATPDNPPRV